MAFGQLAPAHTYTRIVLQRGQSGWRSAWSCFAPSTSNCPTMSGYSLPPNPTLCGCLNCFPSVHSGSQTWLEPHGGGAKWPVYLPWEAFAAELYPSVNQAATVRMNPRVLSPCLLAFRVWPRDAFPAAKVLVIRRQAEGTAEASFKC